MAEPANDGSYKIKIDKLPGDPNSYYYLWSKHLNTLETEGELLYTINYYFKDGNSYRRLDPDDFYRDFSVKLYIPNIKNYLVVHKAGEDSASLSGAEFSLYRAEDVKVTEAGYQLAEGAKPYDTVTTRTLDQKKGDPLSGDGCAIFPSSNDKVLEMGDYYLIETKAPDGYTLYPEAIHVIVDSSGVYVDAGAADDGVATSRYVGTLVDQYAPVCGGRSGGRHPPRHQGPNAVHERLSICGGRNLLGTDPVDRVERQCIPCPEKRATPELSGYTK